MYMYAPLDVFVSVTSQNTIHQEGAKRNVPGHVSVVAEVIRARPAAG
jgi:hypothetical protein